MTVNTSPTNSRVKELPVNKEVITTSQEKKLLEDLRSDLILSVFKLGVDGKKKFPKLAQLIEDAILEADRNAIGAEDRRNERT